MNAFDEGLSGFDRQLIATFGVPVTLPVDRFLAPVLGIFDDPSKRVDVPDGGRMDGVMATLQVIQDDINGIARRDVVIVEERPGVKRQWSIKDIDPDGCGFCTLYLSEYDPAINQDSVGGLY